MFNAMNSIRALIEEDPENAKNCPNKTLEYFKVFPED